MESLSAETYVGRLRPYLLTSLMIFVLGIGLGHWVNDQVPDLASRLENSLRGFVEGFRGLPAWKLVGAIFLNNAAKTLLAIILGMVFGIAPVFFLLINGAALGIILNLAIESRGVSTTLLTILPHGILELPAVFLGTSIGMMLGILTTKRLAGRHEIQLSTELGNALRYFFFTITPVLAIAAAVEVFITPLVSRL